MKVNGAWLTVIAMAVLVMCVGNSFAYDIEWSDEQYYAGAKVSDDDDWQDEELTTTPGASAYFNTEDIFDYGSAMSDFLHFYTDAYAESSDTGEARALALFYGKMTLTNGTSGIQIPYEITGHLTGFLDGEAEGDGYFRSSVSGGILAYDADNPPDFADLIESIKDGEDLPEEGLVWRWNVVGDSDGIDFWLDPEDTNYPDDTDDIDFTHTDLVYITTGQPLYVLMGMGADVYAEAGNGYAWGQSSFNGDSFDVNITQAQTVIPEPATMVMFALGLTGVGILRKRKNRVS